MSHLWCAAEQLALYLNVSGVYFASSRFFGGHNISF